jgi:hypothetical protein
MWAYWGFHENKAYYRATFIPVAEYLSVFFGLAVGKGTHFIVQQPRLPANLKKPLVVMSYLGATITLTVGLAFILAGNIQVYNDY